jgi:hypothetical protein
MPILSLWPRPSVQGDRLSAASRSGSSCKWVCFSKRSRIIHLRSICIRLAPI